MTTAGTFRPQLEALEDRTMPSSLAAFPSAFQGLDVAVQHFQPSDPCRIVSPVFALNYGQASPTTLPAQAGLSQAASVHSPSDPCFASSPVFFGLADQGPPGSGAGS